MNLCLIVLKCNAIFTCEKFLTFLTFLHEPMFYILYNGFEVWFSAWEQGIMVGSKWAFQICHPLPPRSDFANITEYADFT